MSTNPKLPSVESWFGEHISESARQRHELRERALYNAVQLHCETGDAMAILDRETAAEDVLATAQQFYEWITDRGPETP